MGLPSPGWARICEEEAGVGERRGSSVNDGAGRGLHGNGPVERSRWTSRRTVPTRGGMTAQISHSFIFQDQVFDLAAVQGKGLFKPAQHGLSPRKISTGSNLPAPISFTGGLLIASDFIQELYLALRRELPLTEEDSLGTASGELSASATAAAPPRPLSAGPSQTRRSRSCSRTITHQSKWYYAAAACLETRVEDSGGARVDEPSMRVALLAPGQTCPGSRAPPEGWARLETVNQKQLLPG